VAGYASCVQKVVDAAGGNISKHEAEEILQGIADEAERLKREGQAAGADEKLRAFAMAAGERKKIEAQLAKKHAVLAALKYQQRLTQLQRLRAGGLSWLNSFRAIIHGMNQRAVGVRDSVQATVGAYQKKYLGSVMGQLATKPHIERLVRQMDWWGRPTAEATQFGERVIKEMETPGSTKDADAAWLAKVFTDVSEVARRDLNRLGAFIGQLKDQGWFPHSHDADRIIASRVGEDGWVDFIFERLDLEKTYKGLEEDFVREHLRELYRTITTGKDLAPSARTRGEPTFKAPPNMAKALGEQRFLHFKNSDAFIEYNRRFGKGTAMAAMFDHLHSSARYAGMMDALGPNPEAMLIRLAEEARRQIRGDRALQEAEKRQLSEAFANIQDWGAWRVVSGKHAIPGAKWLADLGAGARSWQVASKLVGAVLSSVPTDPVTVVNNLTFQGKPLIEAWAQVIRGYLRGRGKDEARHLAFVMGEGYEGMIQHALTGYHAADQLTGRFSRMAHLAMKWQGMIGFTDVGKATTARIMAADAGHHLGFAWDNLPIRYRNVLELQGITPEQWQALRQARHQSAGGTWYLDPSNIAKLADSAIDPLIQGRLDDAGKAVQAREQQMKDADAREAGWVQKRTDKFLERFQRSRDYLEGLRGKMDEAAQKRTDALQERIDRMAGDLSEIAEAYEAVEVAPGVYRRIGREEGRLIAGAADLRREAQAARAEAAKLSRELGEDFGKAWGQRTEALDAWLTDLEDLAARKNRPLSERQKATIDKRVLEFEGGLDRARQALAERRGKMDARTSARADALLNREAAIAGRLTELAMAFDALETSPATYRRMGRDEGRLSERAKTLAKDAKALEREVQARGSELGKRYLDTWQKWQADLATFVERIEKRQEARAAEAKELPDRLARRVAALRETARNDLEIAYRRFVSDEVGFAIPESDARSAKWTTWGGTQTGTVAGEAARSVMQMKGFPIAFTQRPLGRGLRSGPDYGSRAANVMHTSLHMGQFMGMLFVAGLMGSWLKDIAKGKEPRSLVDEDGSVNWKTIGAAFMQGGGAGIYGDFLFGETNRFGGGMWETMTGPLMGTASDVFNFMQSVRDGEPRASRALQLILGNTPFINFWATRAATDYLFISSLREWASPGYLARQEAKMRKEYGQEPMVEPLRPFG
jgi:hypothetical protein